MNSYVFGYYIGYVIVTLVVACIFGVITKNINESKGYDGGFAWGFWLGVIGIVVVAVRQDNPARYAAEIRPSYLSASAPLSSPANWRCTNCGKENYPYMHECSRCGSHKSATVSASAASWKCICGETNPNTISYCTRCRRDRSESRKPAPASAPAPAPTPAPAESALDMLERLGKLHESGVLTDAEFAEKKAELLKRL